jgi:hypothetical protein
MLRAIQPYSADGDTESLDSIELNEILTRLAVLHGPKYVPTHVLFLRCLCCRSELVICARLVQE